LIRPCRRWPIAGTILAALIFVAGSFAIVAAPRYVHTPTHVAIHATPIEAFDTSDVTRTRFGALEFRGGLALIADDKAFGGVSAINVEPDGGHFLAITDNGSWLRGRIVYRDGRPVGIADAEMAPILGPDGKPLAARGWFDVESLTARGGMRYIGIERVEKIVRFDYAREGLAARGEPIPVPGDFKTFTYNKSLECLAAPPKGSPLAGALIAVTERSLDAAGNHRSYVLDGRRVTRFSVKRSDDFDVSDCTVLPPNDLLLLERRYTPPLSLAVRIRRLRLADINQGALVDGRILFKADLADQIDNMEGIAVTHNGQGETIITLVSDDNFSALQRNLLLQFALVGE
jgi:hypothetical protein